MPFLIPVGMMAGGAVAGYLANRKSARTSTAKQTGEQRSIATSRRTLLPEQKELVGTLSQRIRDLLLNPGEGLAPIRTGLRSGVNTRYSGVGDTLATKLLAHGGARSGKFGTAMRQAEMSRLGGLGDVDSQMARMILEQQERGTSLAERLLGMDFGAESFTSGTSQQSGEAVGAGSGAAGAMVGGLQGMNQNLITMLAMNQMLQGGR